MTLLKTLVVAFFMLASCRAAPAHPIHVMTFAGDSIMQGDGATGEQYTVTGRLTTLRPNWFIRNYSGGVRASVTGYSQTQLIDPHAIVPLLGDTIVVFLGSNDWAASVPEATFLTSYDHFISVLEFLHPTIICVTPIWRVDDGKLNSAGYTIETTRADIARVCTARGHAVVDGTNLIPHNPAYFESTYGLHPNDAGYLHYATNLSAAIGALVQ